MDDYFTIGQLAELIDKLNKMTIAIRQEDPMQLSASKSRVADSLGEFRNSLLSILIFNLTPKETSELLYKCMEYVPFSFNSSNIYLLYLFLEDNDRIVEISEKTENLTSISYRKVFK